MKTHQVTSEVWHFQSTEKVENSQRNGGQERILKSKTTQWSHLLSSERRPTRLTLFGCRKIKFHRHAEFEYVWEKCRSGTRWARNVSFCVCVQVHLELSYAAHKSGSQGALKLIPAEALLWLQHWTLKPSQRDNNNCCFVFRIWLANVCSWQLTINVTSEQINGQRRSESSGWQILTKSSSLYTDIYIYMYLHNYKKHFNLDLFPLVLDLLCSRSGLFLIMILLVLQPDVVTTDIVDHWNPAKMYLTL